MKFNKLLLGLAAAPLLLASCSNALTFEDAQAWISQHYTHRDDDIIAAIPTVSWDFHATNGTDALNYVIGQNGIFMELKELAGKKGIKPYIIPTPGDGFETIGQMRVIPDLDKDHPTQYMVPLNSGNFKYYSANPKNDTYKVNNGCFSVTYKNEVECLPPDQDGNKTLYTAISVYNNEGYCTDFGYKVYRYLNKDNVIKFKLLIHFTYEDDPID